MVEERRVRNMPLSGWGPVGHVRNLVVGLVFVLQGCSTTGHASAPLGASADERSEVIRVAQSMFDAMARGDSESLQGLLFPGTRLFSSNEGGSPAAVHVQTAEEFIASVAAARETLIERIDTPEVRIDGNVADLWAPYTFHLGARLSHCGHDSFHFVRQDGNWRITAISYTRHPASEC